MASNYTDVIAQLTAFGLKLDRIDSLVIGRMARCRVQDDREKRGWYILHEVTLSGGEKVLVGSYGIWHGADNNAQKIDIKKIPLSDEQKAAIRQRMLDDRKRAKREQEKIAEECALRADKMWRSLEPSGECDYLTRKHINAHGVRFTPKGAIAVPMLDISGRIHGLQFILDSRQKKLLETHNGRDKHYWPTGMTKKGHFHLIGSPTNLVLIAEGYATAASLFEATNLPVAVAFDAGNLEPVARQIRKRYRTANIVICADDDAFGHCKHCQQPVNNNENKINCPHCEKAHGCKNAGAEFAELAALAVSGRVISPRFADPAARFSHYCRNQGKLTDFNDVHVTDGLHLVRVQIESALLQFGWLQAKPRDITQQGGGESANLKPIDTTDELIERYSLVYGKGGTVFDHQEHMLLALSDMRDACMSRETHRRWQESPQRKIVRAENVGFDPAETDPKITCNLWGGWPTSPQAGNCELLKELLYYMCSGENNPAVLVDWVTRWLAFPIQHPGAKMSSTIVVHGPQGTGKNLFFESVMKIYDRYGRIIDQSAVEDKFNDWASSKLFMIADEVVARSDLYHIKNKLKGLITGEWIRINPKNIAAYEEKNHVNIVFLSNELMPVVLEDDDRRHCIIWTPPPKRDDPQFYKKVAHEMKNGGVSAFHDYLLNYPLGDFNENTKPPLTGAKDDLLDLSMDTVMRFYQAWMNGEMEGIENMPAESKDVYNLYEYWCGQEGLKPVPNFRMISHLVKRAGVEKLRRPYLPGTENTKKEKTVIFPKNYDPRGFDMNWPEDRKRAWLKGCIDDFRTSFEMYKNG